jgi:hypothetical protein
MLHVVDKEDCVVGLYQVNNMNNIFRQKKYKCDTNDFSMQQINCTAWDIDTKTCKTNCSLGLFDSPTKQNCIKCEKRTSYSKDVLEEDKKFVNLTVNNVKPEVNAKNIKSYLTAEMSQFLQGKVDDDIYNERKEKCMSCPSRINNVSNSSDEIGWCTSCGCGIGSDRTKLSVKLRMPSLFCPLGKFSSAMGKGFKITDAIDSVKGTFKVVKKVIE